VGLENLLSRLEGVRQRGPDRWIAKCPSHADRTPSVTIRDLGDGRILIHCFAGCEVLHVLQAIGLDFGDVFPERLPGHVHRGIAKPFSALDALRCLTQESAVVAIAAADITVGKPLSDIDLERIATAAGRIASALEVCT
jgi:hypothetical protein